MKFHCPQCEQDFDFWPSLIRKLRFCSLECRRLAQKRGIRPPPTDTPESSKKKSESKLGDRNPMWKGDAAKVPAKRARAIRRYALGTCDLCDQPAVDRHHIDGDVGNNEPENIATLCRRCHMQVDGRLDRFGWEIGINRRARSQAS